jgi:hypothetical protein
MILESLSEFVKKYLNLSAKQSQTIGDSKNSLIIGQAYK